MISLSNLLARLPEPEPEPGGGGLIRNPLAPNLSPTIEQEAVWTLGKILTTLISTLIIVAAVAFFFYFLIGAIKWIMSGGDKAQIEAARGQITNALIGFVIVLSFFAIAKLIETLFGVSILQIDIDTLKIK